MGVPAFQTDTNRNLIAYRKWLADTGVSTTTGWRWIKSGWIRAINIAGRLYVSHEEIESFTTRAKNGEFAKPASGAAAHHGDSNRTDTGDYAVTAGDTTDPSLPPRQAGMDHTAAAAASTTLPTKHV